jgi:hypothetical protein
LRFPLKWRVPRPHCSASILVCTSTESTCYYYHCWSPCAVSCTLWDEGLSLSLCVCVPLSRRRRQSFITPQPVYADSRHQPSASFVRCEARYPFWPVPSYVSSPVWCSVPHHGEEDSFVHHVCFWTPLYTMYASAKKSLVGEFTEVSRSTGSY